MKQSVMVIANCHCLPIAEAFRFCSHGVDSDYIDVNFLATDAMQEKLRQLDQIVEQGHILMLKLSDHFSTVATDALVSRYGADKVVTFTNLHFTGLHPDVMYLGPMGGRVRSFFGDYHSKIAAGCYVSGLSEADCFERFNDKMFEKLGYYDAFEESAAQLRERDQALDVRFADRFFDMVRTVPSLFTFNHPTGAVLLELSAAIARHIGVPFQAIDGRWFPNHLATVFIWPIYPSIAEHHGVTYECPQRFILGDRRATFTLREYVAGSYGVYAESDQAALDQQVRQDASFTAFQAAL